MSHPLGSVLNQLRGLADPAGAAGPSDGQLLERFAAGREEAAFAGLLRRHGPMVLAVCRRVTRHRQDAEDAFQATFLLLARKAGSIRRGEALGGWLHRVAFRLALRARAQAERRRQKEHQAAGPRPVGADFEAAWRELQAVLDEELARLPARYRAPLVLCYLQGKTQEEAARELGWPLGTVRSRLARARECLRSRLARRGLGLSLAALTTALLAHPAAAALPGPLAQPTLQAALHFAAGRTAPGLVPARAAALARAGTGTQALRLLKVALALVLAAGLAAGVAFATRPQAAEAPAKSAAKEDQKSPRPAPAAQPDEEREAKDGTVTGRVLTPDGKPAAGARVALVADVGPPGDEAEGSAEKVWGQTTADRRGRFRLPLRRAGSGKVYALRLIAAASGYGLGWKSLHPETRRAEADIRLFPEQTLRGRLVDLQGQPAARVKLHLLYVGYAKPREDHSVGIRQQPAGPFPWPEPVTTDARGRFALPGLGRGLLAGLHVEDDRFARQDIHRLDPAAGEATRVLLPPQVVEGRVVGADTGKPLPGVRLMVVGQDRKPNQPTFVHGAARARADAQGRFRVSSYPGNTVRVTAYAPAGTPYLTFSQYLAWPAQAVRRRVEVALPRGVLVSGRVTELPAGRRLGPARPAPGVQVHFWPQKADNPNYRDDVLFGLGSGVVSGPDGKFRIAVLPGPGTLLFQGTAPVYVQQVVYRDAPSERIVDRPPPGRRPPADRWAIDGLVRLDPRPGTRTTTLDVTLRRGRTVSGRLLDADGKPVAHAKWFARLPACMLGFAGGGSVPVADGRFTLTGCDPDRTYPVLFLDADGRRGAVAEVPGGRAGTGVTVRLAPCGSAVMRLVDGKGRPLANYRPNPYGFQVLVPPGYPTGSKPLRAGLPPADTIFLVSADWVHYREESLHTDAGGRLTLPVLIPGATYRVETPFGPKEFTARAGQAVDLGDLRLN